MKCNTCQGEGKTFVVRDEPDYSSGWMKTRKTKIDRLCHMCKGSGQLCDCCQRPANAQGFCSAHASLASNPDPNVARFYRKHLYKLLGDGTGPVPWIILPRPDSEFGVISAVRQMKRSRITIGTLYCEVSSYFAGVDLNPPSVSPSIAHVEPHLFRTEVVDSSPELGFSNRGCAQERPDQIESAHGQFINGLIGEMTMKHGELERTRMRTIHCPEHFIQKVDQEQPGFSLQRKRRVYHNPDGLVPYDRNMFLNQLNRKQTEHFIQQVWGALTVKVTENSDASLYAHTEHAGEFRTNVYTKTATVHDTWSGMANLRIEVLCREKATVVSLPLLSENFPGAEGTVVSSNQSDVIMPTLIQIAGQNYTLGMQKLRERAILHSAVDIGPMGDAPPEADLGYDNHDADEADGGEPAPAPHPNAPPPLPAPTATQSQRSRLEREQIEFQHAVDQANNGESPRTTLEMRQEARLSLYVEAVRLYHYAERLGLLNCLCTRLRMVKEQTAPMWMQATIPIVPEFATGRTAHEQSNLIILHEALRPADGLGQKTICLYRTILRRMAVKGFASPVAWFGWMAARYDDMVARKLAAENAKYNSQHPQAAPLRIEEMPSHVRTWHAVAEYLREGSEGRDIPMHLATIRNRVRLGQNVEETLAQCDTLYFRCLEIASVPLPQGRGPQQAVRLATTMHPLAWRQWALHDTPEQQAIEQIALAPQQHAIIEGRDVYSCVADYEQVYARLKAGGMPPSHLLNWLRVQMGVVLDYRYNYMGRPNRPTTGTFWSRCHRALMTMEELLVYEMNRGRGRPMVPEGQETVEFLRDTWLCAMGSYRDALSKHEEAIRTNSDDRWVDDIAARNLLLDEVQRAYMHYHAVLPQPATDEDNMRYSWMQTERNKVQELERFRRDAAREVPPRI
jgi:hypothetical protein